MILIIAHWELLTMYSININNWIWWEVTNATVDKQVNAVELHQMAWNERP